MPRSLLAIEPQVDPQHHPQVTNKILNQINLSKLSNDDHSFLEEAIELQVHFYPVVMVVLCCCPVFIASKSSFHKWVIFAIVFKSDTLQAPFHLMPQPI